jgi:type VI secretion system ImpM family protein
MSIRLDRFGCFGKLPVSREFIEDDPRRLAESGFDRWIGEGLGLAKARFGPRADKLVNEFPGWHFLWKGSRSRHHLYGLLTRGEDGAGRRHPFSLHAWCEVPGGASANAVLSLANIDPAIAQLLDACRSAPTPQAILELVRGTPAPHAANGADLHVQARNTPVSAWLTDVDLARVVANFNEALNPMKGKDPATARYAVALPVSPDNSTRDAALWLDLVQRRIGKPLETASVFWPAGPGACDVLIFFKDPSGPQWAALIDPNVDLESLSFLRRDWGSLSTRATGAHAILARPNATLADLLDWKE